MKKYKLAVLISHPIQYHSPIFRALAANEYIDPMVYYCWDFGVKEKGHDIESGARYQWDIPLLEGYSYTFLKNYSRNPSSASFFGQINPGIVKEIWTKDYDAILVHGYSFLTDWFAFLAAFLKRTPILFRGIVHDLDGRPWYMGLSKRIVLTLLFKVCSACLYIGTHNRKYYKKYCVSDKKLFHVPHVVDNDFFRTFYEKLLPERDDIRKRFGFLDNRPVILYLSRLVAKKRPMWVLDAYKEITKEMSCGLIFVGEGPERIVLEKKVRKEHIPDVVFTGFLNQTEVSAAYIAGDIFALPSLREETWGLVVNEAMNFGLPIVISDKVGCGPDLVSRENGYIISSLDDLTRTLSVLVRNAGLRIRLGEASKRIISHWGISESVRGIREVLDAVTAARVGVVLPFDNRRVRTSALNNLRLHKGRTLRNKARLLALRILNFRFVWKRVFRETFPIVIGVNFVELMRRISKALGVESIVYSVYKGSRKHILPIFDKNSGELLGVAKLYFPEHVECGKNEVEILKKLKEKDIESAQIPDVLYSDYFQSNLKSNLFVAVFSSVSSLKNVSGITGVHTSFLKELFEKTKRKEEFLKSKFREVILGETPIGFGRNEEVWAEVEKHLGQKSFFLSLAKREFPYFDILRAKSGYFVIDWELARFDYPPIFDVFSLLMSEPKYTRGDYNELYKKNVQSIFFSENSRTRNIMDTMILHFGLTFQDAYYFFLLYLIDQANIHYQSGHIRSGDRIDPLLELIENKKGFFIENWLGGAREKI